MINRIRRQLPSATVESVSNDDIMTELNIGADECNRYAQIYKGYTEFTSEIGKQVYALSQYVPNYLGIEKSGVWFLVGTSLKELFPKTKRWLDLNIRNWKDLGSGEPQWYYVDGNDLLLYPKPSTASTVRIYHLLKATPMDNLNNYPWLNTTTEVTALQPMDKAIIAHARWQLSPAVGKLEDDPNYSRFLLAVKDAQTQIRRRPDISSNWDNSIKVENNA